MPTDHSIAIGSAVFAGLSAIAAGFTLWQARRSAKAAEETMLANRDMASSNASMAETNKEAVQAARLAANAATAGNRIAESSLEVAREANAITESAISRADEANSIARQSLELLIDEANDKKVAKLRVVNAGIGKSRDSINFQFKLHNFGKNPALDATATLVLGELAFLTGDSGDIDPGATRGWYETSVPESVWNSYDREFFHIAVRFRDLLGVQDLCIAVGVMNKGGSGQELFVTTDQTTGRWTSKMADCIWKELNPPQTTPLVF